MGLLSKQYLHTHLMTWLGNSSPTRKRGMIFEYVIKYVRVEYAVFPVAGAVGWTV